MPLDGPSMVKVDVASGLEFSGRIAHGPSRSVKTLQRCWRLICALAMGGLTLLIWAALTARNERAAYTWRYSESVGVELNIYGCDVRLVAADSPTLVLEYVRGQVVTSQIPLSGQSNSRVLSSAKLFNLDGCAIVPYDECSRRCLITVGVTPAASGATFTVSQDATDEEFPTVTLDENVTVRANHRLLRSRPPPPPPPPPQPPPPPAPKTSSGGRRPNN